MPKTRAKKAAGRAARKKEFAERIMKLRDEVFKLHQEIEAVSLLPMGDDECSAFTDSSGQVESAYCELSIAFENMRESRDHALVIAQGDN